MLSEVASAGSPSSAEDLRLHYNLGVLLAESGEAGKAAEHAKAALQAAQALGPAAAPEFAALPLALLSLLLSAR